MTYRAKTHNCWGINNTWLR